MKIQKKMKINKDNVIPEIYDKSEKNFIKDEWQYKFWKWFRFIYWYLKLWYYKWDNSDNSYYNLPLKERMLKD